MMQFEVFAQGQNGASAVTDGVFDVGAEFGKGLAVALGDKHRVVAKALVAALLCGDAAIDDALKKKFAAIVNIGNGGAETGIAVRVALQFLEQECGVGFRIVVVGVGIARRVNTGPTAERLHLQTRIVGKTVVTIVGKDELRLEQGVTLKGIGCFGNIAEAIYFVKAEHLILTSEYGTNLR